MSVRYDFRGQVAVVTGGAQGIGRAIAEHMRDAGARVAVWDRNRPDYAGVEHAIVDVTRPETIATATTALSASAGRIDILVNNAGYVGPSVALDAYDPVEWRALIDVNLIGVYEVSRHVVPVMKRQSSGRIVNIASIAGKEGTANATAYSAAKAGVIGLTKALAKELIAYKIFVNAVAPGPIATELLKQMSDENLRVMLAKCPMGRLATTDECAELVMWLASDAASFNTGAVFDLSGGRATY
jgi:2-dehydro-3-deoxy-L-rhamnonate dehydrogenase (NAD+)